MSHVFGSVGSFQMRADLWDNSELSFHNEGTGNYSSGKSFTNERNIITAFPVHNGES